jgi:antitoxin (DNA-binding transcriptional repressor) of toxin-antitoxin stability system
MIVSLKEAQENLPKLLKAVVKGEELTILSDDGAVKVIADTGERPSRNLIGSAKGLFIMSDDFNAPLEEEEKAIYGEH